MDKLTHWRSVPGELLLEASNTGEIRRLARKLVVKPRNELGQSTGNFRKEIPAGVISQWLKSTGYLMVSFMVDGKTHRRLVHRLVAKAFASGEFDGATVDHIDGDKTNNISSNLQWVTRSENTKRQNAAGRGAPKGENHPLAKLKDADIPTIFQMRAEGKSLSYIGKAFGVSGSLVHKITTSTRRLASSQPS